MISPFYIEAFLDGVTCRRFRALMDGGAIEPGEVLDDEIGFDADVRRVASIDVDPSARSEIEGRLDAAREAVGRHFGLTLTDREGVNFLRYERGGLLPVRTSTGRSSNPGRTRRAGRSRWSFFLNTSAAQPGPSEFSGGELCLIDARVDVVPREGLLVAFDAGLLHEVAPVAQGTRRRDRQSNWF